MIFENQPYQQECIKNIHTRFFYLKVHNKANNKLGNKIEKHIF